MTKSRKKVLLTVGIILCVSAITFIPLSTGAESKWERLGYGSLNVEKTVDGYILYPVAIDYIEPLQGVKGKEMKLGTENTYRFNEKNSVITLLNTEKKDTEIGGKTTKFMTVDNKVFLQDINIGKRLASKKLVTEDQENLWLVDETGQTKELLSKQGKDALLQKVMKANETKGEDKVYLNWASNPETVSNGTKVAFISNKNSAEGGTGINSVYVVDEDGSNEILLINAETYGDIRILGTAGDAVVANTSEDKLVIANTVTGGIVEHNLQGMAYSSSPNGKFVLFRKDINETELTNDFYILNLETLIETKIQGMPNRYVYNTGGEWSPDGTKFAFIANGLDQIDTTKYYRDNNILVVLNTETMKYESLLKPNVKSSIYPLGSIQWIGQDKISIYLDDNTTWAVETKKL